MDLVRSVDARHPRAPDAEFIRYGTSGFRDKAVKLDHILARMGAVAVYTSLKNGSRAVGMMITASHNPAPDNGVKLVNADGAMVGADIEQMAVELCNSSNFIPDLEKLFTDYNIGHVVSTCGSKPRVIIGRDTRSSSFKLARAAMEMIKAVGGEVIDLGVVTTPQLHFAVWHNANHGSVALPHQYFQYFRERVNHCKRVFKTHTASTLYVDAACGVGAYDTVEAPKLLSDIDIEMVIYNDPFEGEVNLECGSDYVHVGHVQPKNCPASAGDRCCSYDGDADRVVYFIPGSDGSAQVIDGDKISVLYLEVLNVLLQQALDSVSVSGDAVPLRIGIVQTAYANGASTIAMQKIVDDLHSTNVQMEIRCTKTGVKNLHHVAEEYDIGVYFEANGHGTVIYDKEGVAKWASARSLQTAPAFLNFLAFLEVFNPSVGDAFTDVLACEIALKIVDWDIARWNAVYNSLPCSQTKVYLPKESMLSIKPHEGHERYLLSPEALQKDIDSEVSKYSLARAFVRPSGTEPLVRLYVEAEKPEDLQSIVKALTEAIHRHFPN